MEKRHSKCITYMKAKKMVKKLESTVSGCFGLGLVCFAFAFVFVFLLFFNVSSFHLNGGNMWRKFNFET